MSTLFVWLGQIEVERIKSSSLSLVLIVVGFGARSDNDNIIGGFAQLSHSQQQ